MTEADLRSIDGVVEELYATISGPAGERDWDRERRLFVPGARLVPGRTIAELAGADRVLDVEGYIASRAPYFATHDLWEVELAREVFQFGHYAAVLSSYEARETADGPPIFRGVNSLQLTHDDRRWWIVSLVWDNERPGLELPERLRG